MTDSVVTLEEFQRVQRSRSGDYRNFIEQLLELRATNCKLEDECRKQQNEITSYGQKSKGEDVMNLASKLISRGVKSATAGVGGVTSSRSRTEEVLEDEVRSLRLKMATQEEEFRLQQATLMEELNKVVTKSDSLEKELLERTESHAEPTTTSEVGNADFDAELSALRSKVTDLEQDLEHVRTSEAQLLERLETQSSENTQLSSSFEAKSKDVERLTVEVSELKSLLQKQEEEHRLSSDQLQQEVTTLSENYRKKQESYIHLNQEKDSQYQEYRKNLNAMVTKKDAEVSALLADIHQLREQLQIIDQYKEEEQVWAAEKASIEQTVTSLRNDLHQFQEQNETFQLQSQEIHSANDCLSAQLQDAKNEVLNMQNQLEHITETADKRKQLLDDLALEMQRAKDEGKVEIEAIIEQHRTEIEQLQRQLKNDEELIEREKSSAVQIETLHQQLTEERDKTLAVRSEMEALKHNHVTELKELRSNYDNREGELNKQLYEVTQQLNGRIELLEKQITELMGEKQRHIDTIASLQQDVKDSVDQVILSERKQAALMKDLKRQAATEKKRADRLQEKFTEYCRNHSPGSFEEVKTPEMDVRRVHNNDSESVSSWNLVLGNSSHRVESDRQSNHTADGNESVCSTSQQQLESDNSDLILRCAKLMKDKSELHERIMMLEESNGSMAEDILNKSAIIEQYIKDRRMINNRSSSLATPVESGVPSSMVSGSPVLSGGLRKMIDLMKLDQSAGDIREMNRRLQLMLEESLTKNMLLEKQLEHLTRSPADVKRTH